jgi:hypothetical protein
MQFVHRWVERGGYAAPEWQAVNVGVDNVHGVACPLEGLVGWAL